jgi:hypothetical protein
MKTLLILLPLVLLAGCADLQKDTEHASTVVQLLDKALGIAKDAQGNVTKTAPADPTGGTVPIVGTVLSGLALAWYTVRKLSGSVPAATHDKAVMGLANSTPTAADPATVVETS